MEKNKSQDDELARFRNEADELLGRNTGQQPEQKDDN
jgi:hypothetical protein